MRQIAMYVPQLDVIVLQAIMDECSINFEWGHEQACEWRELMTGYNFDVTNFLLLYLGEL